MKKRRIACLCLIFLCLPFLFSGCERQILENPGVRITFFDVGKGDAILIETENHSVLIDSGYDDTSGTILNYLAKQNLQQLDYMILTHFDKDHVGGTDRILKAVEVGKVLQPD